jgi:hypothetical protein
MTSGICGVAPKIELRDRIGRDGKFLDGMDTMNPRYKKRRFSREGDGTRFDLRRGDVVAGK